MPEATATRIAERCRCDVVLDMFLRRWRQHNCLCPDVWNPVIALDTSPTRLALARHNAALHGLSSRIEFVLADFRSFAARVLNATSSSPSASSSLTRKIDVVFLSPPWGGPEYHLARTQPEPASELFRLARLLTPNVAFYVPRHTVLADIAALLPAPFPG
ncbi:RNA cap guanine-N2 methyltransferase domain containing protein [Lactarius tabidus]